MINQFIRALKPAVQREVLKNNLSTFLDVHVLAKSMGFLDDYLEDAWQWALGLCKYNGAVHDPISYVPIDLDAK